MLASALSTIGYYVLAIVLGIAANVLTPAVTARLRKASTPAEVAARPDVVLEGRGAEALVVSVGMNVVMFALGATLVLLGAAFTVVAVVLLTHNVGAGLTIPGIHSARDFLAGIAQGAGFGVVFAGAYWMTKGFNDMVRLQRAHRNEA